jgi:hypothetical protein
MSGKKHSTLQTKTSLGHQRQKIEQQGIKRIFCLKRAEVFALLCIS